MLLWLSPALSPQNCQLMKHSFPLFQKVCISNVNEVKAIVTRETREHNKAIPQNEAPSSTFVSLFFRESVITDKYCYSKKYFRKKKKRNINNDEKSRR